MSLSSPLPEQPEFHSTREWVAVQDIASAAAAILRLTGEWALIG